MVGYDLEKLIRIRYLRIVLEDWYGYIVLRVEFYGCKISKNDDIFVIYFVFCIKE